MIVFWVVAGVLAAAAAGLVLLRAASAARGEAGDPTRELYRRQLAEIDELADQGLIGESERRSAQAEAGRRLLRAAEAPATGWRTDAGARGVVLISIGVVSAVALVAYGFAGAPGAPDQPFAARLAAWGAADPASLTPPQMAAVLASIARERPQDADAFRFLAVAASASQDSAGAARAMRQAVRVAPQRADLWELLGQALVAHAGGEITPEAQAAFREALKRDPKTAAARFYLASARLGAGDKAGAVADWRALAADLSPNDPRRQAVAAAIAGAEAGPASAAKAAPTDPAQLAMIMGMVEGLSQRLSADPDDPEGWVRLVRAYAVLGETSKRDEALRTAQSRYAAKPDILARLDAAARAEPMR